MEATRRGDVTVGCCCQLAGLPMTPERACVRTFSEFLVPKGCLDLSASVVGGVLAQRRASPIEHTTLIAQSTITLQFHNNPPLQTAHLFYQQT